MTTTTKTLTHQMIFVNMPVADLDRSREFFTAVGYEFDERMCNEQGLGLKLGGNLYAMLLTREFFNTFHQATAAEPGQVESLICLSAESRAEVDEIAGRAIAAGAKDGGTEDYGGSDFMYGRAYTDLDGHVWEVMWMDVEGATRAGVFPE